MSNTTLTPDSDYPWGLKKNCFLDSYTTLGIGGVAEFICEIYSTRHLIQAICWAKDNQLAVTVLGKGSNAIIRDGKIRGLVLVMQTKGIVFDEQQDDTIVHAQAGEHWSDVVAQCVEKGLFGIECLSGIPGSVGAAPIQNIGAYGQEFAQTLIQVQAVDMNTHEVVSLNNVQCEFGHRKSRFNSTDKGRFIIIQVRLRLAKKGEPELSYPAVMQACKTKIKGEPTLQQVANIVIAIRRQKSMVIDRNDPWSKSAGSFFVNPIITGQVLQIFKSKLKDLSLDYQSVPKIRLSDGAVKLFSAWLIENAGFYKGYQYGAVGLSKNHALAIVNLGGASAAELVGFAFHIQSKIKDKFALSIKVEPEFIGWEQHPLC